METTYPTRPNRHELSNRRDELRTTKFFTPLPRTGRGDKQNSFFLVLRRGIETAAAACRFVILKLAPTATATLLFSDVCKKSLHTEMMMGAIRTSSVYKMQEVDKNILAPCGPTPIKTIIASRACIDHASNIGIDGWPLTMRQPSENESIRESDERRIGPVYNPDRTEYYRTPR